MQQTDDATWNLNAKNFYMFDENYLKDVPKTIKVDPHLPFLYIPDADFTHFAFTLNKKYENKTTFEGCDYTLNYCRFNVSCDVVK